MEKEICNMISSIIGVPEDKISAGSTWRELGIDSVQCLEIVMGVEELFSVTITDEEGEKFFSVADMIACVAKKKGLAVEVPPLADIENRREE